MELTIILLMILIIVAIGAIKLNGDNLAFPFKKRSNLFTPVERSFLDLIESAVGDQYRIVCRVRLSDILTLRQGTDKKTGRSAMLKANSRYLDFILCDKQDLSPVVAVDLVHQQGKEGYKSQRDWFVSSALDAARIPHLRIKVKSGYSAKDIRDCIDAKLAPVRYKEPKKPLVQGTMKDDAKSSLNRPVTA
ncbi:DUF2726 domain-containing protein [Aliiglaciecola sp. CAU 1673]|uniref:DUF2726 domain-containing protein n=1 Tax=Aliiglaciecola sp. CAU 1673 TaxID=3032595 RepID=UPI0023DB5CB0|nr:DUF2726 domain-containing protein [Aliiglaciecola sp. CAU 1673]MDF2178504.1 DUF2726 domain-containing protein [Aliiglaciecola sp. CAU 1673]